MVNEERGLSGGRVAAQQTKRRFGLRSQRFLALLGAAILAIAGCSSGAANRNAEMTRGTAPGLSPEQCAAGGEIAKASLAMARPGGDYRIQPGDDLNIDFYLNPEFNEGVIVAPDGKITMRYLGLVQAAGMTPQQLSAYLNQAYQSELRAPGVSVHIKSIPSNLVYVHGQVAKPGMFTVQPGMTALQAISDAGGYTDNANPSNVMLIRRDACGMPQGSLLDLQNAVNNPGAGDDAVVMARDVIYVPRSKIAKADLWMKQHFRDLLPIPPYMYIPMPIP